MPFPVIPGQTNPGRTRERFEAWLQKVVDKRTETVLQRERAELILVAEDVIENGPAYTGASVGDLSRAKPGVSLSKLPRHPAFGYSVYNKFEGAYDSNEAGWQIVESARERGRNVTLALMNNMWNPYLKYVEYNAAPHQTSPGHFVRDAWMRHLARRRA